MHLSAGERLGPYEVVGLIGKGGMGEVYRARDTRLHRDVAIKVSAERFTERFDREARVVASLNHPNICTLFDVGPDYLVMELIEGPTLEDRLKNGAIPPEEALHLSGQIIEALNAAHERGVIHRDLKPGNIKIRPDGTIKVLDFGLAKAGGAYAESLEDSPTVTTERTNAGVVLGTAAYMSPEQALGKPVDKRADIWGFGVVLYEMLTGERLYKGETTSETIASVLKEAPDLSRIAAQWRPLLRACLQKNPKKRLHDIEDARILLEALQEAPATAPVKSTPKWVWPVLASLVLALVAVAVLMPRGPGGQARESTTQIPKPDDLTFNVGTQAAISPDARWLAFPALGPDNESRMYIRSIATLEVRALPGSEGIIGLSPPPFWSSDSLFVMYGALSKLMKSEVTITPAQTVAVTGRPFLQGGTVNRDGVVLYANNVGALLQVSINDGGTPAPVTVMAPGEVAHRWPQFLPDGKRFLYQRVSNAPEKTGIYIGSLAVKPQDQDMKPLLLTNRHAMWFTSESGATYLMTQQEDTLRARSFDLHTGTLSGTPVFVAQGVGAYPAATAGMWSVASDGTLVYRAGGAELPHLAVRDTTGKLLDTLGDPGDIANPSLSPDGRRVAFRMTDSQGNNIFVRDLNTKKTDKVTFTLFEAENSPIWSLHGEKIIFSANRNNRPYMDLYEMNPDGSGERLLWSSDEDKTATSVSRDGKFLLFHSANGNTREDLWVLPLDNPQAKASCVLRTESQDMWGRFSPDGQWIVYSSTATGTSEVYIRPFSPTAGCSTTNAGGQKMSVRTGSNPLWSGDGKQIFYTDLNLGFMAVDFPDGTPHRLFTNQLAQTFGLTQTGPQRFVIVEPPLGPPPPLTLMQNWTARLKQ